MTSVAIGVKDHSGWGVVVAVAGTPEAPKILLRRRVELLDPALPRQPYHAAVDLDLGAAAALVEKVEGSAMREAERALSDVVAGLRADGADVVAVAVAASTMAVPDRLESILGSHPLLHAAEGQLYREALAEAAARQELPVTRYQHKTVMSDAAAALGTSTAALQERIGALGKELGPPWQRDHKDATAAALVGLVTARGD